MNIQQISNFIPKFVVNNNQNTNSAISTNFGLKMSSPLKRDTVSFRGTPKLADKTWEINKATAMKIRKKLEPRARRVFDLIDNTFGDLVATPKDPEGPILEIGRRLKSVNSIAEKTGSRQWVNSNEIIENMTDLIGAKIVLRDSNKNTVDSVLGRFIPMIKSGVIELLEIENKRPVVVKGFPEAEASKYDYASINMLKKMANIQNTVWKKGGNKAKVATKLDNDFTNANYCAIHYLFRIPGKNAVTFELQVLGNNTNKAKHIDDAVYKIMDGKNPSISSDEFKQLFAPLDKTGKFFEKEPNAQDIVQNARELFNKYRSEVFLYQRTKADMPYSTKKVQEQFLPIPYRLFPEDIERRYGISSLDFDFNNIAKIQQRAEREAEKAEKAAKAGKK